MMRKNSLSLRASVNAWIGANFPEQRKYISHSTPMALGSNVYRIDLLLKHDGATVPLGTLRISRKDVILIDEDLGKIEEKIRSAVELYESQQYTLDSIIQGNYEFHFADGIFSVASMRDYSIDLLLTDPPYGISKSYVCEKQIPRRLRSNGTDFIMPKGNFGNWDQTCMSPSEWTGYVLPKVSGWAVIFCAHAQIGEYCRILEEDKFVAITPMVWHKTNPVPFNHKFKPVNAWEAIVAGKRPGTKFNGRTVHNVFTHKSPSPQNRIHPTQKPGELLSEFVRMFSNRGDLVVDPYAGSASTLVAAAKEGRKALGYENDPAIFDKASRRLRNSIGLVLHDSRKI